MKNLAYHRLLLFFSILVVLISLYAFKNYNNPKHFSLPTPLTEYQEAENAQKQCEYLKEKRHIDKSTCYNNFFYKLTLKKNPTFAFRTLYNLQNLDHSTFSFCHIISHGIGRGAYDKDPKNWEHTLQKINLDCNYGAVHGLIERYSVASGHLDNQEFVQICGSNPNPGCVHALGHIALLDSGNNLNASLEKCSAFMELSHSSTCMTGVFMETMIGDGLFAHGYIDATRRANWYQHLNEFETLCRSLTGEKSVACWEEIAYPAVPMFHNDQQKILQFCSSSPTQQTAYYCRRNSVSVMLANTNFDLLSTQKMCGLSQPNDPDFRKNCYTGIIASATANLAISQTDKVFNYCNSVPNEYQTTCYTFINKWLKKHNQGPSNIADICHKAGKYQYICQGKT